MVYEFSMARIEPAKISVGVLEDDRAVRGHLAKILAASVEVRRVYEYKENKSQLDSESCMQLDVLHADLNLPDGSASSSISFLARSNPNCFAIAISVISDAETVPGAINADAVGYLHKNEDPSQILSKIHQAVSGGSPISPSIARQILSIVRHDGEDIQIAKAEVSSAQQAILTPREKQVMEQLELGLSYSEAAESLFISVKTLPVHVRNIYRKLQVRNRTEAISEARKRGLLGSSCQLETGTKSRLA